MITFWRQAFGRGRVAKAQAVLSETELLRAMFDVGYFPPNTPPCSGLFAITDHDIVSA